jgi:hypothetical protein
MATAQYQDDGGPMGFDEEDEGGGVMGFVDATEVRNTRTIPSDSCVEFDRERGRECTLVRQDNERTLDRLRCVSL